MVATNWTGINTIFFSLCFSLHFTKTTHTQKKKKWKRRKNKRTKCCSLDYGHIFCVVCVDLDETNFFFFRFFAFIQSKPYGGILLHGALCTFSNDDTMLALFRSYDLRCSSTQFGDLCVCASFFSYFHLFDSCTFCWLLFESYSLVIGFFIRMQNDFQRLLISSC